jgi:phospholipase C
MNSRRDFLKKAALLAAGGGFVGALPASIQKAFAIDPPPGSTFLDAEHVVILMQENRSFDHAFGKLRGVRGFNDPRAMTLPDGHPVWLQTNATGETYSPFRLNLLDTKATWMGSLPHTRESQIAAFNHGKHDRWLQAKRSGEKEYRQLPLTLGFYNRDDLPFYYALADAFTICDQNFCSAMTCTTPNRLYLWSGTIRAQPDLSAKANLNNEDADFNTEVNWATFPERLEKQGVSWRVYQNEVYLPTGFEGEEEPWLSNFGDNPLEYFKQYQVRFSATRQEHMADVKKTLVAELEKLSGQTPPPEKKIAEKKQQLAQVEKELATWNDAAFAKLSPEQRNIFEKAFTTNTGDPNYRELTTTTYQDGAREHEMQIPKGDVLYQFRRDVRDGKLPAVSWIVPPERFSDHPSSPWYGAWYLSEVFDILTQNPDVWRKTIFILCYDENDGYFDHVPPFIPPHPNRPETGKVSAGIDTSVEQISPAQEKIYAPYHRDNFSTPIGLGFRVPLLVASPWSRGGYVCSQVFDHTSILQFLETFLSHKTGKTVRETNISEWRRTVCGDLTSVFRPYAGEKIPLPEPVEREKFLTAINRAQFRPVPDDFKKLNAAETAQARENPQSIACLTRQESGARAACALPYELTADGNLSADRKSFRIQLAAKNELFGVRAAGAPFRIYAPGKVRAVSGTMEAGRAWNYAISAGDKLTDDFSPADFDGGIYHLQVSGPNGFYREFRGTAQDPLLELKWQPAVKNFSPAADLQLTSRDPSKALEIVIEDLAYGGGQKTVKLNPAEIKTLALELNHSSGWHDFRVRVSGAPDFAQRFAGHVETGRESSSDPAMGKV